MEYNDYLSFIKYSIADCDEVPDCTERIDWRDFLSFCNCQGIAGLVFGGLERAGLKIGSERLFEWVSHSEAIKKQNILLNRRCKSITKFFTQKGLRSCILKGQANGLMYPYPEKRTPGDIDIWVEGDVKEIISMVREQAPNAHYEYHHVEMPVFSDVAVEVHYRPAYLPVWWKNRRLQKYIDAERERQFCNRSLLDGSEIGRLTDDFNAVVLMAHMFGHFFSSRNNLKQVIDYYYLLKLGFSAKQRDEIVERFQKFGMMKYARGIMWIEHEVLGLDEQFLLVKPNETIGRLLLAETLNYGHELHYRSKLQTLMKRITNNLHLLRHFPAPVLVGPLYLVWHQWWKIKVSYFR